MPARTINNIGGSSTRKRSRREADSDEDGDEEQVVAMQEAGSSLQSEAPRKRVRISAGKQPVRPRAARDRESSHSSEEDEDVAIEDAARDNEPPATQYEILRDNGFKHLQHADEDDRRATQRLQRKGLERNSNRAGAAANTPADNGILESIHCVNFMCHESLHVDLGPHLNFIVGENGSGKSAILTAITICLGGKASSTNRGGSLKAFIKEGQHEAILIIKIKNQGDDAYQPLLYGDTIIVERHFNMNGSSSFKVMSANNKIISRKKQEVDDIVEYFCLQVDNPLNVLSQDNARQFLNQASAKQKYKYFVQGVQLQQLDEDYRLVEDYLNANESKVGDLETKLENSRRENERAQKNYALVMESSSMRQQHQLLRQKLGWSQVADQERKLAETEEKIAQADGVIGDAQRNVEAKTQELERLDEQVTESEQDVATAHETHDDQKANLDKAKEKAEDAKKNLLSINNDERDAHSRATSASANVKDYEQKISKEEQRLQDLNGDAHARKNNELEAARARSAEIAKESADAQQRVPDINKETEKTEAEVKTIDRLATQKRADVTGVQKRIRELEQGRGSLYDAYERQMPQLLRMIEEDAGFDRKPVGPLGAHIQVLQPEWSPMLEKTLGEALNGFVVASKHDQQRLKSMMQRLKINKSPIIISNSRPIDTSRSEPDDAFNTILRILKIDDPLIRNTLIINNRIEKTILVQEQDEANRIMLSSAPPRNVSACYHMFPPKGHGWTVRITVNQNGYSSSPTQPLENLKPRLKSDSQQEISLHREKLIQLQAELKDLQNQKSAQQQITEGCRKKLAAIKQLVDKNKQKMREVQVDIDNIQAEIDTFDGVDDRLEGLRVDLAKAKEEYEHYGTQYGGLGLRKQEQNQLYESLRVDFKKEKAKLDACVAQLEKVQDEVKRRKGLRQMALQEKNEAHDALQLAINEKRRQEAKREQLKEVVADFTTSAEAMCPRVHVGERETYELIEKKLDSLDKTLKERERKRGMTDEEVKRRLIETKKTLKELQETFDGVEQDIRSMKNALNKRLAKWRMFQRFISSASRANFMYLLSERDFRGRLLLDHEHHTLEVQVEPDKTRKNAAARNTKTLSGGEKSFSSICLLLAIWEAMGSPIRCLDEFDVFMDNVNRAISTNMLISAARSSVGRQFILITPNAIEGRANLDKDVKITRMRDPRQRGIMDMLPAS